MASPSEALDELERSLDAVEKAAQVFVDANHESLSEQLTPVGRAKLFTLVSYGLNTLSHVSCKVSGESIEDLDFGREFQRVKDYVERVKKVSLGEEDADRSRVNKPAAKRVISHALAPTSASGKEARRRV